jgi:hypothetical protein
MIIPTVIATVSYAGKKVRPRQNYLSRNQDNTYDESAAFRLSIRSKYGTYNVRNYFLISKIKL